MYEYRGTLITVVDGDTIRVRMSLGLDVYVNQTLRLYGINTPEMNTEEGKKAKEFVLNWFWDKVETDIKYSTIKDRREKYGRYLVSVFHVPTGESLNSTLLKEGLAVPYLT